MQTILGDSRVVGHKMVSKLEDYCVCDGDVRQSTTLWPRLIFALPKLITFGHVLNHSVQVNPSLGYGAPVQA